LIQLIIRLHLFAAAVGIFESIFKFTGTIEHICGVVELGVLCVAFYLSRRHRQAHHGWMHARTASEICRSFLACWPLRRTNEQLPNPPFEDQDELVHSLRMAWYLDRKAECSLEAARDQYIADRVDDQIQYFGDKYKSAGDRGKRLKLTATIFTALSIVFLVIMFGMKFKGFHDEELKYVRLFAKLFPLIPPALLSLLVAQDLSRRAMRLDEVTVQLQEARERLRAVRTWPGLWREVNRCEAVLLREVAEWQALTRFGSSH
jgi:hypothetical protein